MNCCTCGYMGMGTLWVGVQVGATVPTGLPVLISTRCSAIAWSMTDSNAAGSSKGLAGMTGEDTGVAIGRGAVSVELKSVCIVIPPAGGAVAISHVCLE